MNLMDQGRRFLWGPFLRKERGRGLTSAGRFQKKEVVVSTGKRGNLSAPLWGGKKRGIHLSFRERKTGRRESKNEGKRRKKGNSWAVAVIYGTSTNRVETRGRGRELNRAGIKKKGGEDKLRPFTVCGEGKLSKILTGGTKPGRKGTFLNRVALC